MKNLDIAVAALFGMKFDEMSPMSTLVYALVGVTGLYQALTWKSIQRHCHSPVPAHS